MSIEKNFDNIYFVNKLKVRYQEIFIYHILLRYPKEKYIKMSKTEFFEINCLTE